MKSCGDIAQLLVDHLYGELEGGRREELETHLRSCPHCQDEIHAYERVRTAARQIPLRDPPPALSARLLTQAGREVRQWGAFGWLGEAWRALFLHPGVVAAASMILVAGVAGYLTLHGGVALRPVVSQPADSPAEGEVGESFVGSTVELAPPPPAPAPAAHPPDTGAKRKVGYGGKKAAPTKPTKLPPKSENTESDMIELFNAKGQSIQSIQSAPSVTAPASANAAAIKPASPVAVQKDARSSADLLDAARERAKNGDCAEALALRRAIADRDPAFYKSRVADDSFLLECVNRERERQAPAKAPGRSNVNAEDAFEQQAN